MKDTFSSPLIKFSGIALAWVWSFIEPVTSFLIITGVLVAADMFTGIKSARKRGDKITSKSARSTVTKLIYYSLAILLTRGMEIVFFEETWIQDHVPITYLVSGVIASIEFQSNMENIGEILGVNIWSQLKKKLSTLLKTNQDAEQ